MPDKLGAVIKAMEICVNDRPCHDCPYFDPNRKEKISCSDRKEKDALELLKEKKPIRPKNKIVTVGLCGACEWVIKRQDRFCPHCGRAVLWDE